MVNGRYRSRSHWEPERTERPAISRQTENRNPTGRIRSCPRPVKKRCRTRKSRTVPAQTASQSV